MLVQKRQIAQHGGIGGVPFLQGNGLPLCFCVLRSGLFGERIHICPPCQLLIRLLVAHPVQHGVQRDAVAMCAAEVAAELVGGGVQAEMILSPAVVAAEGAARLDLPPPKRPRVEDKPAPPGRVHDGDFFIDQAVSPLRLTIKRPAVLSLWEWAAGAVPPGARRGRTRP